MTYETSGHGQDVEGRVNTHRRDEVHDQPQPPKQHDHAGENLVPSAVATERRPVYNVEAWGAAGDGTTDDTTAIQDAIDAATADGGTVFFPAGDYLVSATLTVDSTDLRLTGIGSKSRIYTETDTVNMVELVAADNLEIDHVMLDSSAVDGVRAIRPIGTHGVNIHNCFIKTTTLKSSEVTSAGAAATAVNTTWHDQSRLSRNVSIYNNTIRGLGVMFNNSRDCHAYANFCYDPDYVAFQFYQDAERCSFKNNTVWYRSDNPRSNFHAFQVGQGAENPGSVNHNSVSGNFTINAYDGIRLISDINVAYNEGNSVVGNTSVAGSSDARSGITISGSGCTVARNLAIGRDGNGDLVSFRGVNVLATTEAEIRQNRLYASRPINASDGECIITDNRCHTNDRGIRIDADHAFVEGNRITSPEPANTRAIQVGPTEQPGSVYLFENWMQPDLDAGIVVMTMPSDNYAQYDNIPFAENGLRSEPPANKGQKAIADGSNWDPDADGNAELVMFDGVDWQEIVDLPNW